MSLSRIRAVLIREAPIDVVIDAIHAGACRWERAGLSVVELAEAWQSDEDDCLRYEELSDAAGDTFALTLHNPSTRTLTVTLAVVFSVMEDNARAWVQRAGASRLFAEGETGRTVIAMRSQQDVS